MGWSFLIAEANKKLRATHSGARVESGRYATFPTEDTKQGAYPPTYGLSPGSDTHRGVHGVGYLHPPIPVRRQAFHYSCKVPPPSYPAIASCGHRDVNEEFHTLLRIHGPSQHEYARVLRCLGLQPPKKAVSSCCDMRPQPAVTARTRATALLLCRSARKRREEAARGLPSRNEVQGGSFAK